MSIVSPFSSAATATRSRSIESSCQRRCNGIQRLADRSDRVIQSSNRRFSLSTLSNCGAHPHDGLALDPAGRIWFDEEFANAIGELSP
jgi:streptogramin lyase